MPKKSTTARKSKAAFVRDLPPNTPAKDVVAKAKAAGMVLSEGYVYNIRATSKAKGKRDKVVTGLPTRAGRGGGNAEDLLRAVAAELGLSRAIGILQGEQARVRRLLGA